jgi:hypothetical protein
MYKHIELLLVVLTISWCSSAQIPADPASTIGVKENGGVLGKTHHVKIADNGAQVYDLYDQKVYFTFPTTEKTSSPGSTFKYPMLLKGNLYPNSMSRAMNAMDKNLVLLQRSDSAGMGSYVFYDIQKSAIMLSVVLIRIDANYIGNIVNFKRKGDSTVMITAVYKNQKKKSMLIRTWLVTPQVVAGVVLPAFLGPDDVSDYVLFSREVENTDKLTIRGIDCTPDASYVAMNYVAEGSKTKDTEILIWNKMEKTWSIAELKSSFDVETLNFNPDGYVLIYGDGSIKDDDFYVINPLKAKKVFSQNTGLIGDYDEGVVFSEKGGLFAMIEYAGNSPWGRTVITIHKTKTGKKLATIYQPADSKRNELRNLNSIGRGYDFYQSDNGIQVIDATPDFRYLMVFSIYSDITGSTTPTYKPLNQYYDIYSLSALMKEDDLGLKPIGK